MKWTFTILKPKKIGKKIKKYSNITDGSFSHIYLDWYNCILVEDEFGLGGVSWLGAIRTGVNF